MSRSDDEMVRRHRCRHDRHVEIQDLSVTQAAHQRGAVARRTTESPAAVEVARFVRLRSASVPAAGRRQRPSASDVDHLPSELPLGLIIRPPPKREQHRDLRLSDDHRRTPDPATISEHSLSTHGSHEELTHPASVSRPRTRRLRPIRTGQNVGCCAGPRRGTVRVALRATQPSEGVSRGSARVRAGLHATADAQRDGPSRHATRMTNPTSHVGDSVAPGLAAHGGPLRPGAEHLINVPGPTIGTGLSGQSTSSNGRLVVGSRRCSSCCAQVGLVTWPAKRTSPDCRCRMR